MTINENTARQVASYIERVERLEEEKAVLADDVKDVWMEAKSQGFDVPAMKRILKMRKADQAKLQEHETIFDTYLHALGALSDTPLGEWARDQVRGDSEARTRAAIETSDLVSGSIVKAVFGEEKAKKGRMRGKRVDLPEAEGADA
jgi:uncharacterized protein (UPF0335 family)